MNNDSKPARTARPEGGPEYLPDGSLWQCAVLCCEIALQFLLLSFIKARRHFHEFLLDTRDLFLLAIGYQYEDCGDYDHDQSGIVSFVLKNQSREGVSMGIT
jgi:hypothetical protein